MQTKLPSSLKTLQTPPAHQTDPGVTKLFADATYLVEQNKLLAKQHLLRIQLLLAKRPLG